MKWGEVFAGVNWPRCMGLALFGWLLIYVLALTIGGLLDHYQVAWFINWMSDRTWR